MARNQFTFYASFFKAIGRIKDDAARAQAYDAICAYALTGEEPDIDSLPDIVVLCFELIKPNLDTARRKSSTAKDKETTEKGSGCADDADMMPSRYAEDTDMIPTGCAEDTDMIPSRYADDVDMMSTGCRDDVDMMSTGYADDADNKKKKKKKKEKEIEIEIENKKEKENESYNAHARDADFERFWEAYPRKVGKKDARRSFDKLKGVKTETLLEAVARQKQSLQWQKDNGQYIPNPATWLNQGRWEDVLQTPDNKGVCEHQATVDASQLAYLREVYAKVKGI